MASTGNLTVKFVHPDLSKCSNGNCPGEANEKNRIDTRLLATSSSVHLWVRLYLCDGCYTRYKTAVDALESPEKKQHSELRPGEFFIKCDCSFCRDIRRKAGMK